MAGQRVINVRPMGAETNAPGRIFQLSDLDHLMPKLYVHMVEIFELPQVVSKDSIVESLVTGLERTLVDYPILSGTLHFDNESRRIVVKKQAGSHLTLHIKDASPEDIPAFPVLDKHDFPVHLLDAPKVLPEQFVSPHFPVPGSDISVIGPAVGGAQITFIEGGIIIGLAITHQVCDGPGFESLFTAWARYTAAAANGDSLNRFAASKSEIPSRSILSLENKPKLTAEELERLSAKFPIMKLRDGPPAPPSSRLQDASCQDSAGLEPGTWISTYDAILSIMWRATVRAKSRLLKPDPATPSKAVHAVNGRGRTGFPISDRYIGTAITMPQSKTFTISEVLGDLETTLPVLAQAVRESTNSVNPEYMSDLIKYAVGSSNLQWSELDMHWVLGLDCMAFDWHTMKSYENHDFGFGTPAALRWPHPNFEGFFFVLPSRAGVRNAGEDEGTEVCFGLEETCYAQLEKDGEFAKYAEQRGLGV
ncbi:Transferase [Fusarium oxysporum f. sp. vasinfectum]|nr:Transferase [Fusarium oxysporum f. sp. vasinfectum]